MTIPSAVGFPLAVRRPAQIRYDAAVIDRDDLLARVRASAAEHIPALASGRAVLAVSGGADSIATAALLVDAGIVRADASVVAHFDHRLRGDAAAAADRAVVEALCARYGLALDTDVWDAPRPGEAAARDARYHFLLDAARRHGIDVIVTGHTSDDQVETVIMHALRGSGLNGLRGMAPQRPIDGALALARPMLCVSRDETRAYCATRDLAYHDDVTNGDPSYLRNRIRLDLLPRIEAAAPDARDAILRLVDEAREGVAALEAVAAAALDGAAMHEGDAHLSLSRARLNALPPAVVPHAWRLALTRLLGDVHDFDRRHYKLLAGAARATTGSVFELPRGVRLTVDADALILSLGSIVEAAIPVDVAHALPFVGVLGAWRISVARASGPRDGARAGAASIVLPAGAVVRGRRPGDRIRPYGMRGHKKLHDYYIDRKTPRRERDAAPVIACESEVLWTPFGAAAPAAAGVAFHVIAERRSKSSTPPLT